MVNNQIDQQSEKILDQYSSIMSEDDCQNFKETIDAIKAHVWQVRQTGSSPSQRDLANFVYDYQVANGTIEPNETERAKFAQMASTNSLMGDPDQIISNLHETESITPQMAGVLKSFASEFSGVTSYEEGLAMINNYRNADYSNTLNANEQSAFESAMNLAEKGVCYEIDTYGSYEMKRDLDADSRGLCEECVWEINWVKYIIAVVITVIVWIFAIITLGFGSLVATVISIAVFAAIWVLHCYWVECESSGPCPEGQEPYCEPGFVLNLADGVCELDPVYQNPTVNSDNCIKVDKLPNGDCPGTSISVPGLAQCILHCFGSSLPDGFGQDSNGKYQYPYICQ